MLFSKSQPLPQQNPYSFSFKNDPHLTVVCICLITTSTNYSIQITFWEKTKKRGKKKLRLFGKPQKQYKLSHFSVPILTNQENLNFLSHKNVSGMRYRNVKSFLTSCLPGILLILLLVWETKLPFLPKLFFQLMVMTWHPLSFKQTSHSDNFLKYI